MLRQIFRAQGDAPRRAPATLKGLFDKRFLSVAAQPKDNGLDPRHLATEPHYLFLIDHDYPGGSAAMHNAVFRAFGLPGRAAFVIGDPAEAEQILSAFRNDPLYQGGGAGSGFKDKVGPLLDHLDPSAEVIGAVNVIAKEDGALVGYNTDGIGFVLGLLHEFPDAITGDRVVILGAGGTALPIAYEIARKAPAKIIIVNRTVEKAEQIADLVSPFVPAQAVGEDRIGDALDGAGLVVNTSNKGAQPNERFSAFAPMTGDVEGDMAVSRTNITRLPKSAIFADILLEPITTSLELARENGNRIHSGRHMNLFQAVPAFRIMTGMQDHQVLAHMRAALN